MRNLLLTEPETTSGCSLFDDEPCAESSGDKTKTCPQRTHAEEQQQRESAVALDVNVKFNEKMEIVRMLQPTVARDGLWVKYEADMLAIVAGYIRARGFTEDVKHHYRKENPDVPQGIRKRKDWFLVPYVDTDGIERYPKFPKLEDAKEFKANLDAGMLSVPDREPSEMGFIPDAVVEDPEASPEKSDEAEAEA